MKAVLIPSTFTSEEKNLYLRNYKIGELARACATFAIDEILVYWDKDPQFDSHALGRYIVKILKYCNTPPYLRKYLFPLKKEMKYVGVIPAIKAPHHVPDEFGMPYRYGYVIEKRKGKCTIDCGLGKNKVVKGKGMRKGDVVMLDTLNDKIATGVTHYVGYETSYFPKSLGELLKKLKEKNYTIIGTSRMGKSIREANLFKNEKIAIAFGSAYRGLFDLLQEEEIAMCDVILNVVPGQMVKSIRTEEAIYYTLSVLRLLDVV